MLPGFALARFVLALSILPAVSFAQRSPPPDVAWRVRVVDARGEALPGVSVFASLHGEPASIEAIGTEAVASTDAEGRAEWKAPARARAFLGARGRIPLLVRSAENAAWEGAIDLGRLVLHRGVPLTGIVRGPDKQGIEGVRALLQPSVETPSAQPSVTPYLVARTDASGVFRIPAVPEGAFDLHLDHDDHLSRTVPCVTPRSPLDITLDPGALISGRCVVAAGSLPRIWSEARTEVGRFYGKHEDDGSFAIRVPTGARYRMAFKGAGAGPMELVGGIATGPQSDIEWRVPASIPELEVRCQNAAGEPVTEFDALAGWSYPQDPPHSLMALSFYQAVASESGVARLPVTGTWPPGRGLLRVRARGYGDTIVPVDPPAEGEPPARRTVTLEPEVVVQGRVLRADTAAPVEGVKVWAMPHPKGSIGYSVPPDTAVLTDAEGRYRLPCLARGTWTLEIHKPGWFRPVAEQLELDPERRPIVTMDDITLAPPETVEVQVTGLEDPERWFVEQRIVPSGDELAFVPNAMTLVRQAASLVEPSGWTTADGKVAVSVFTMSGGTNPYPIRRSATLQRGDDGVRRIAVADGRVCRVAGRWDADDFSFVERLGVVARATSPGAEVGSSEIRADGAWGFEVPPGSYTLKVVDLATMVELSRGILIDVIDDQDEIEIEPEFEVVTLEYAVRDPSLPLPIQGARFQGSGPPPWLPKDLRVLLLPPEPMTLTVYPFPPGQLGSTAPYRLGDKLIESTWYPGMERWVIEVPAPLTDEELLKQGEKASGR